MAAPAVRRLEEEDWGLMAPRRFSPPWTVDETDPCFIVRDHKRGGRYSVIYLGQTANVEVALPSKTERRAQAQRHVNTGNQVIARQRELIARKIAAGQSTLAADSLLEEFLRTQAIFEEDLAALVAKG